jgi:hypothetical protein
MNMLARISNIKHMLDVALIGNIIPNSSIKSLLYRHEMSKKSYIKSKYKKYTYANVMRDMLAEIPSHDLIDIFSWI